MFRERVRDGDLVGGLRVAGDDEHGGAERPGVQVEDGAEVVGLADVVRVAVWVDVRGQGPDDLGEDGYMAEDGVMRRHWLAGERGLSAWKSLWIEDEKCLRDLSSAVVACRV